MEEGEEENINLCATENVCKYRRALSNKYDSVTDRLIG